MQIIWYGKTCFKIISQEIAIISDPFSPKEVGFKNPRLSSEIIIFSSLKELKEKKILSNHFVFFTPGEYEVKNVFIYGIPYFEGKTLKTIYQLDLENIKICFLGEISKNLTDEEIEKLSEVDILILPVFGKKIISSDEAIELINKIQPSLIIPSCWKEEDELLSFIKKLGFKKTEALEKLKIKKKDLLKEKTDLVVLKPSL